MTTAYSRCFLSALLGGFAFGSFSVPSYAQDARQATVEAEEIIVTARRRREAIQDVPVAITAFSGDTLREQHITSNQDLAGRVPSLIVGSVGQQRNSETFTLRGQGAQYLTSQGVVMYAAEAPLISGYFASTQGGPGAFLDLENMQVLKGPQGTLFGRNTTGGAILLEPARPTEEFGGYIQGQIGNYKDKELEGVVNIPIVRDKLLVRGAFRIVDRDGFTTNLNDPSEKLDDKRYWTGRVGITFKPTDRISNYLMVYNTTQNQHGTGTQTLIPAFGALGLGPRVTDLSNSTMIYKFRTYGAVDIFSFDITDNLTFRNIASYSVFKSAFGWDLDGGKLAPFNIDTLFVPGLNSDNSRQWTEEAQLQGKLRGGRLVYTIGGYIEGYGPNGLTTFVQHQFVPGGFEQLSTTNLGITRHSHAGYAQATYDLGDITPRLDGLKVTAGIRYTWDLTGGFTEPYVVSAFSSACTNGLTPYPNCRFEDFQHTSAPNWLLGIDYKVTPTILTYFHISKGYKAGGINASTVDPSLAIYQPEFVKTYEFGVKSDFHVGTAPARLNMAFYRTDYSNLQRGTSFSAGTRRGAATFNIDSATIQGVELEAEVRPFKGLDLAGNWAYIDAHYDKFLLPLGPLNTVVGCNGFVNGATQPFADMSCAPFLFTPKNTFSVSAHYTLPMPDRYGQITLGGVFSYQSSQYTSGNTLPAYQPFGELSPWGVANFTIDWKSVGGSSLDAQLFVTNAFNRDYRISNSNLYPSGSQAAIWGEPRMFGGQLKWRFGSFAD